MHKKLKEGYEAYREKQQKESSDDVKSVFERVRAEETYYSTQVKVIKNGWMTKEEVVKLEHQMDSVTKKDEQGVIHGQIQKEPLTFKTHHEKVHQPYFQKRTGTVKNKKDEQEMER
ncbi:Uncharacterised protein [Priestia megaterium]|nr:Uncharacterised protein [Priestia megaterium]